MNKGSLGLVLVILGVSVAAVFGARNTAGVNKALILEGNVSIPQLTKSERVFEFPVSILPRESISIDIISL